MMLTMRIGIIALLLVLFIITRSQEILNQKPRLGGTVNIFSRYGYLSISMRVVSRNDSGTWIFREPTLDGFYTTVPESHLSSTKTTAMFDGDFHMEFCDNIRQLLQAYFRGFIFERLERPWRAFTNSWSRSTIGKHLGIEGSLITSEYCYVLIRVSRFRDSKNLTILSHQYIDRTMRREANNITIGDSSSVFRFIKNFGSHYISSFVTGNSLYQVLVYSPPIYQHIKERLKVHDVNKLSSDDLKNYLSPWYANHIGAIQSASGNRSVEAWAMKHLQVQHTFISYPTLLKLHGEVILFHQLQEILGDEALLQINFRTLAPLFDDLERQKWFLEVIDNYSKLWEINM